MFLKEQISSGKQNSEHYQNRLDSFRGRSRTENAGKRKTEQKTNWKLQSKLKEIRASLIKGNRGSGKHRFKS